MDYTLSDTTRIRGDNMECPNCRRQMELDDANISVERMDKMVCKCGTEVIIMYPLEKGE